MKTNDFNSLTNNYLFGIPEPEKCFSNVACLPVFTFLKRLKELVNFRFGVYLFTSHAERSVNTKLRILLEALCKSAFLLDPNVHLLQT
jgi:hypothetical protein